MKQMGRVAQYYNKNYSSESDNTTFTYMGCPESFWTFKIARHRVDLVGCGKCYSLVMSLANWVAKTALPYLA